MATKNMQKLCGETWVRALEYTLFFKVFLKQKTTNLKTIICLIFLFITFLLQLEWFKESNDTLLE